MEDYAENTHQIGEAVHQGIENRERALEAGDLHEVYRISGALALIASQLEEFDRAMYLRFEGSTGGEHQTEEGN